MQGKNVLRSPIYRNVSKINHLVYTVFTVLRGGSEKDSLNVDFDLPALRVYRLEES